VPLFNGIIVRMDEQYITINGEVMPFTTTELLKILKVVKKAFNEGMEKIENREDQAKLDDLIKELEDV